MYIAVLIIIRRIVEHHCLFRITQGIKEKSVQEIVEQRILKFILCKNIKRTLRIFYGKDSL